ncbi:MAG: L-threonine 3-dehydrogenase [Limnochordia bacterium]|nr:L-threonine 3-dehydrogenase [Bacillota bacterium]NLH32190.1 L-threonine 3-dehydrogenase [Bacillota bacterium]HOB09384.1 L-threonine 3-dehydrogenase [Limnochordia bacterium]HPZ30480.1 L-threonine 3-dehydrogenase [Limnochordia bacterium]HQD70786.1 L-threonine 3-dehydrogenase [Limnochordia bacterium]
MKALVKKYRRPGLWLDEVPIPAIGKNDVLVKVIKTSICGTDVHIYDWDQWAEATIPVPMVIGHEFVGRIAAMGENVSGFEVGDLVSAEGHLVCGRCRNCLAGRRHLCNKTLGVGVNRPGVFAEYVAIPASNVWLCNPNIDLDVLSCFDPLGNAVHSALAFDLLGEDVLITGAGPIGCMAAAVAKHAGARHVVVTDLIPYRLELAKKMGATLTVDVRRDNLADVMHKLGMKEGFDVGLEMSGSGDAFRSMLDLMCHGGKIAMLGIMKSDTQIDWNKVVFSGITIKGIYGREMYETWYKMTTMIESGLDISPVITHRFHYTEFEQGFAVMKSGLSGKVILNWEE